MAPLKTARTVVGYPIQEHAHVLPVVLSILELVDDSERVREVGKGHVVDRPIVHGLYPMVRLVPGKIYSSDIFTRRHATVLRLALRSMVTLVLPVRPNAHLPRRAPLSVGIFFEAVVPRVTEDHTITGHFVVRGGLVRRYVLRQLEFQRFE